jgi:hypothetical protein
MLIYLPNGAAEVFKKAMNEMGEQEPPAQVRQLI